MQYCISFNLTFLYKNIISEFTQMQVQLTLLDGQSLTIPQLDIIIRDHHQIDLSPSAWQKVHKCRQSIINMMSDPMKVVYGITTGFGSFANIAISHQLRQQLQINLIRSHAVGVGEPISLNIVKRMIVLRINTLAKGRSGIRPETMKQLIAAFNHNFLPLVPCQGTVGASGDLAPLAHLSLGLLGEGQAYDFESMSYKPAASVLNRLGLHKLQLKEKQGLALINGTQFMTSIISQVASATLRVLSSSLVLYAIAVQVFGVQRELFTKQTEQFYAQFNPQLSDVIHRISGLIGSEQSQLHKSRKVLRDVHSLLDYPQSMASFAKLFRFANKLIEEEMNGATDNPLVYFKEDGLQQDELISAGNFHGEYVAKSADILGFALFQLGKFSQARIQRYINGKISGLPHFLIKNGGLNSGFMIAQYTTAALLSESKVLVQPASTDSIVTSAGQEDHVSMGGFATRKCKMLLDNIGNILGIQLLMALTALNILEVKPSEKLFEITNKVKKTIEPMSEDRFFGPDIEQARRLVIQDLQVL